MTEPQWLVDGRNDGRVVEKKPKRRTLGTLARGKPLESEAGFTKAVLGLAKLHGWCSAHFRPALTQTGKWVTAVQGDGKGFPDLVLVRGTRLIFAELKSAKGTVKPEQTQWLLRLGGAGAECYIWRPKDWKNIEAILTGGHTDG